MRKWSCTGGVAQEGMKRRTCRSTVTQARSRALKMSLQRKEKGLGISVGGTSIRRLVCASAASWNHGHT